MTPAPLDVSPFVARILAACPSVANGGFCGRAADHLTAINEGPQVSPAVYVLEPSYTAQAGGNYSDTLLLQLTHWLIPVLTCVRNLGDARGDAAGADGYNARTEVFAALVGFKPDPNGFTVRAGSGKPLAFKNGFVYYIDVFALEFQLRNQS